MSTLWKLDPTHSEITFKVKHMMISNVKGEFRNFDAEIIAEDDTFTQAKVQSTVQVNSIDTNNADRDNHLKNADFFNTELNPVITFESTSLTDEVAGKLTINGVTREINLDVDFGGINKDPWGNTRAGFSFTSKISRKDFDLNWNAALETGGVLVGDTVNIAGELQFIKN